MFARCYSLSPRICWTLLPCHITGYPAGTWTGRERAQISPIVPESGKTREDDHSTLDGLMETKRKDTANCRKRTAKVNHVQGRNWVTQSCLLSTQASASLTLWHETKFWQGISYYQEKLHVQAALQDIFCFVNVQCASWLVCNSWNNAFWQRNWRQEPNQEEIFQHLYITKDILPFVRTIAAVRHFSVNWRKPKRQPKGLCSNKTLWGTTDGPTVWGK